MRSLEIAINAVLLINFGIGGEGKFLQFEFFLVRLDFGTFLGFEIISQPRSQGAE